MFSSKYLSYILVLIGCFAAVYAQAEAQQSTWVLILGIVVLMFGLYRVYSTIPHKKEEEEKDEF
jgi:general stress protein CsbA